MGKVKLLPCPFCGGMATIQQDRRWPIGHEGSIVAYEPICTNPTCLIYCADTVYFKTEKAAAAAWNKRANLLNDLTSFVLEFDEETAKRLVAVHQKREGRLVSYRPERNGAWIIGDDDDDFDVKCPECGFEDVFDTCGIGMVKKIAAEIHYCQNCGAKMDGGAE